MLLDNHAVFDDEPTFSPLPCPSPPWGASTEYHPLKDVMLCDPRRIAPVPCCSVTVAKLAAGFDYCPAEAARQHAGLVATLTGLGIRCHLVPAVPDLPDLAFARDAAFMTPWGLLLLNPAAAHRRTEPAQVAQAARGWGAPIAGVIAGGHVEGGDICLLRDGVVAIGHSGERTDAAGAAAVASFFEARGWQAIRSPFDPGFLHLDTQFSMLDAATALACVEVLDPRFVAAVRSLGIDLVPVTADEVQTLGANVLSLGDRRIVAPAGNPRLSRAMARCGFEVIEVELSQFVSCGGGVHCLTMPLARHRQSFGRPSASRELRP